MDKLSYEMIEDNSVLTIILRAVRALNNHQIIKEGLGEFCPKTQGIVRTAFCTYKTRACGFFILYGKVSLVAIIFSSF